MDYGFRSQQFAPGTITQSRLIDKQVVLLGTTSSVDLTSTGATTIHTVSANRVLILGATLQISSVTGLTTQPEVSIGVSPGTADVFASQELLNFTDVDQVYHFWGNLNTAVIASNTDLVVLNVVTGATATTMDVTVRLYGIPL